MILTVWIVRVRAVDLFPPSSSVDGTKLYLRSRGREFGLDLEMRV